MCSCYFYFENLICRKAAVDGYFISPRYIKSAQANARAIGARVVNYSESWSIDSTGNITMMASTTVTSDSGVKGWKELAEEREEKLKEKKEQERAEEKRKEQKEQEEERLEKIQVSAHPVTVISDAYHKPVDIKA